MKVGIVRSYGRYSISEMTQEMASARPFLDAAHNKKEVSVTQQTQAHDVHINTHQPSLVCAPEITRDPEVGMAPDGETEAPR
jgi:hypothetical protein